MKAVLLEDSPEGVVVRGAERIRTPAGSVENGVVAGRKAMAAEIREVVRRCGGRVRAATIAVPTEHIIVRWVDLPLMDSASLRAATRFEARKYLPYPVDRADVQIVPMGDDAIVPDGRMRGLLVACPRDVVRSRAEALEAAGLEVAAAGIEPFAVLRSLGAASQRRGVLWRGQPTAYVMLGEETSGIFVVQDGHLRFVRSISWGGARITNALAEKLGCSREEAEEIKERRSSAVEVDGTYTWEAGEERKATDALASELGRMRREIQRLLNYYRSLFPERSYEGLLNRVVLSGGPANLRGLDTYFSAALEIEVAVRSPFESVASRLSPRSFAAIGGYENSMAVALGLAMEGLTTRVRARRTDTGSGTEYVWRRKG